jgi:hypothetical protein
MVAAFQSLTVSSSPDVARNLPSPEKATPVICLEESGVDGDVDDGSLGSFLGGVLPLSQPRNKTLEKIKKRKRGSRLATSKQRLAMKPRIFIGLASTILGLFFLRCAQLGQTAIVFLDLLPTP